MKILKLAGTLAFVLLAHGVDAAPPPAPANVVASQSGAPRGIRLNWDAVPGATSYAIAVYPDYFATTRLSTISINASSSEFVLERPCGVYEYFEISATNSDGPGEFSNRVFGYTNTCALGTQSCDYKGVPLTGEVNFSVSTVGSRNDYRIGDRAGACEDGNDPGTAGTGPDIVFSYVSQVDCAATITLTPEGSFEPILYVADTCEPFACDYYSNVFAGVDSVVVPMTANTEYFIFIDGYNDFEGQSAGICTLDIATDDCEAPQSCALSVASFSTEALPEGWSTVNRDGGGVVGAGRYAFASWHFIEDFSGSGYNRVAAAYSAPDSAGTTDDWLIAGPYVVDQDSSVTWRDARVGGAGSLELDIYVADTPDPEAFLFEGSIFTVVGANIETSMTTREVPLAGVAAAAGAVYIGLRHRGSQSGYLLLDDFGVCGEAAGGHAADYNNDNTLDLGELLRVIQLYNAQAHQCDAATNDGFAPGQGLTNCVPHTGDYAPTDWRFSLSELLRMIQIYNLEGYLRCPDGEELDGICAGG